MCIDCKRCARESPALTGRHFVRPGHRSAAFYTRIASVFCAGSGRITKLVNGICGVFSHNSVPRIMLRMDRPI